MDAGRADAAVELIVSVIVLSPFHPSRQRLAPRAVIGQSAST